MKNDTQELEAIHMSIQTAELSLIGFDIEEQNIQDFKTKLQELSQRKSKKLPEYNLLKKEGPSHSPIFTVSLKV